MTTVKPHSDASNSNKTRYTTSELWRWTLSKGAIAPCFVKDAFEMKECDVKSAEFFWLGRVPCRTVHLVGLIIGVQVYEKRTVYTLDDGTGVIECASRHPVRPVATQTLVQNSNNTKRSPKTSKPHELLNGVITFGSDLNVPPEPVASVGTSVRVTGRLVPHKQGRTISVDKIEPCRSLNEEPEHWIHVCNLYHTYYFAPNAGPFVIPQPQSKVTLTNGASTGPSSSISRHQGTSSVTTFDPQTPSRASVCTSAATSPSMASSPVGPQSPPRLRHPSRLHTRDLTANTFRIYVKHYMDNAPPDSSDSESDEDPDVTISLAYLPDSPTKPRKRKFPSGSHNNSTSHESCVTPRPTKRRSLDSTPLFSNHITITTQENNGNGPLQGFTISHLRRVPELALLARRVVDAEAKRRAREQRKASKEQPTQPSSSVKGKSRAAPFSGKEGEGPGPKMKRLFRFAIRQLYDEGSIILFDGPKRKLPIPFEDETPSQRQIRLWKSNMSTTLSNASSSLDTLSYSFTGANPESGTLSDPDPGEESYIPLTPSYLFQEVERAITSMISRAQKMRKVNIIGPINEGGGQVPGPTASEILRYLRKKDDRWARLGEWHVKDALEWGKEQGRVWCVGKDRWEVCG